MLMSLEMVGYKFAHALHYTCVMLQLFLQNSKEPKLSWSISRHTIHIYLGYSVAMSSPTNPNHCDQLPRMMEAGPAISGSNRFFTSALAIQMDSKRAPAPHR